MSKPSEEFEQAYDNFLAGCDVDTTMLDCAEFMFNAGRESVGQGEPVAQPYAHIYEFDSAVFGTHRSFSPSQWNGIKPTRTVAVYTHPTQPVQPDFSDAYQGAREDAEIWKKRALEAEGLNRKFIADINSHTFMGEPAQPVRPAVDPSEDAKRTLANPPERVYLQVGDVDAEFPGEIHWRDVTWCEDQIERTDLLYVRSDLIKP